MYETLMVFSTIIKFHIYLDLFLCKLAVQRPPKLFEIGKTSKVWIIESGISQQIDNEAGVNFYIVPLNYYNCWHSHHLVCLEKL